MASKYPPRRFVRVPKGVITGLPAGATRDLYLLLWQSSSTKRIPGLIRGGVHALAEEFGLSATKVRKGLLELELQGRLACDLDARIHCLRGAIEIDPPANANVLIAWAIDFAELPASPVRDEIRETIRRVLQNQQNAELLAEWESLTVDTVSHTVSHTVTHTPYPYPVPDPIPPPPPSPSLSPDDPVPEPPPQPISERLRPYLDTFERLGAPFDYAAAAARFSDAQKEKLLRIDLRSDLGPALQGLGTSFFAGDRARARPTLHDLIVKASLRQELREGNHEEVGRRWGCAVCGTAHGILEDCPPTCRSCHYRHPAEQYCGRLQSLIRQEREETEREVARRELDEKDRQQADAEGFTPDPLGKEAA